MHFDCARNKWGVIYCRKCMLAEDYWRKLRLKLQGQSAPKPSESGYKETVSKANIALYTLHQASLQVHCPEQAAFVKANSIKPISKGTPLVKPGTCTFTATKYKHMHTHKRLSLLFDYWSKLNFKMASIQGQNVNDVDNVLVACKLSAESAQTAWIK